MNKNKNRLDLADLILEADLADYSPVKGCMVIKPYGYAIWELIQKELDQRIKSYGHKNAYFPLFIPESFLQKEADHVEGFSPECAFVTHAGGNKLEENLVIRPTSETIIYHMFSKWIRSWRDLPYSVNQWANVVRWEMRTRLFLRTTEFLWQEGHTAHASPKEAQIEALTMQNMYLEFLQNILALAPIAGEKTELESFAGAKETYSLEVLLKDGKILQAATSHNLGVNFAKAFEIKYQNKENKLEYAHLCSWGASTRLIGAIVLGHRDQNGLVLPPKIAPVQIIIIPIYKNLEDKNKVLEKSFQIKTQLENNFDFRVEIDLDEQLNPGSKFYRYELKGVPIRINLGIKDLKNKTVEVFRRDLAKKYKDLPEEKLPQFVKDLLEKIQKNLYQKNLKFREENTYFCKDSLEELNNRLDQQGGFAKIYWSGEQSEERLLKKIAKATIRTKLKTKAQDLLDKTCLISGKPAKDQVYVGRAY